jgi:hypothetical protein
MAEEKENSVQLKSYKDLRRGIPTSFSQPASWLDALLIVVGGIMTIIAFAFWSSPIPLDAAQEMCRSTVVLFFLACLVGIMMYLRMLYLLSSSRIDIYREMVADTIKNYGYIMIESPLLIEKEVMQLLEQMKIDTVRYPPWSGDEKIDFKWVLRIEVEKVGRCRVRLALCTFDGREISVVHGRNSAEAVDALLANIPLDVKVVR